MLLAALAALAITPYTATQYPQSERDFAAVVVAGAACQHLVNGVPLDIVTTRAAEIFVSQGIDSTIVHEADVVQKAKEVYNYIKTRKCKP